MYENYKIIYGPYKSKKDGRWRISLTDLNNCDKNHRSKFISYPKYLMEMHLFR